MEKAGRLLNEGYGYNAIATAIGIARRAVEKWQYAYGALGKKVPVEQRKESVHPGAEDQGGLPRSFF